MASMTMLDAVQAVQRRKWEYQQAVPPLGGKYWGEKLTEYGGIGGYPFHGQQRVRDLFVTRSHRHFGSGVTKAATYDQPYRVTNLSKSGCRINDERLSAPMKTKLDDFPLQRAQWPGNHPYYSHKSIFEVFPEVKPNAEQDSTSDGRSSFSTNTTNSYDDALRRLHNKLHHTSLYQQTYKDHFQETSGSRQHPYGTTAPHDSRLESLRGDDGGMVVRTEGGGLKGGNREDVGKESTDEQEKNEDDEEEDDKGQDDKDEEEEEDVSSQGGSSELRGILVSDADRSVTRPKSSKSQSTKRSVSFNETPQVQILDSRASARDDHASELSGSSAGTVVASPPLQGTGPCWPPSTSLVIENIRGSQLLERRDITNPPAGVSAGSATRGRSDPLKKMLSSSKIGEHIAYIPRPPLGPKPSTLPIEPLPSSLKSGSSALASLKSDRLDKHPAGDTFPLTMGGEDIAPQLLARQQNQPFVIPPSYRMQPMKPSGVLGSLPGLRPYSDPVRKLHDEIAKRIMIRKGYQAAPLVLPPAPLSECLTPAGSKTPHRLGLRYKSEAHKRYHSMYPEEIPDLRSTRNSGRKCFFDGDHSSVFRG